MSLSFGVEVGEISVPGAGAAAGISNPATCARVLAFDMVSAEFS
jgi:hypothetical protein